MKILTAFEVKEGKRDYHYLNVHYDSNARWSTAFLVSIRPKGLIYEYLVPCALDENDALAKFKQHLDRLVHVASMIIVNPTEVITLETFPDAFDGNWRKKIKELEEGIELAEEKLEEAIIANNQFVITILSMNIRSSEESIDSLKEKLSKLKSQPSKVETGSALSFACTKQFQIMEALDSGYYSVTRLPNDRVIPVSYFDDARGELTLHDSESTLESLKDSELPPFTSKTPYQ